MNSSNFKNVNLTKMYYELHGQGQPVILVAGFSCDHSFWMGILEQLASRNQVLLMDNRGVGRTICPDTPFTIDMMADDVLELSRQLNLAQPIIVGQSMGSAIAQNIAKRYPDQIKKIILVNTFSQLTQLPKMVFELLADLQRINLPLSYRVRAMLPWVYSSEFLSQPKQLENLMSAIEKNPYPQSLSGYEQQLAALKQFNSEAWSQQIKVPTHIIAGSEDLIAPLSGAQSVQSAIGNNTQLTIVPGGHASPIEQPHKVANTILQFIG